ncbi:juvenile hormone acid O-methyltransferase-like [Solenopsis invicta]|uniref:juvenile hormone acid O-methyltransferase n=1 Tax=Solenopsis invicta TaxID=13686 RepID=UPI000E33DF8B|nr:juvenile hormone acid O-methyltransferase [Solenopsis invicta]XP_039309974.1 juvenile hormone acid O-methyltransferase-like [Solenopsis invicta]XP_039309976.1 juvenile hormone acid O-methyltransferase-like [Solenopsis invicta]
MTSPEVYSANDNVMKHNVEYILEEFAENLTNICGKCMDVGCGPGDITKNLLLPALGSDAQIIGTDISEKMIKYANVTSSDEKRVQFEVLDIETKNLPKKYITEFKHVFSFHALHYCYDIRQAFKNIYQILRPNGTALLYIVASDDLFEVLRILAQDVRFEQYIPDKIKNIGPYHNSNNARKELKELLQSVGFTVHHCSLRERSHSEKKSELFLKSILSILPFFEDMPNDVIEKFKKVLIYEYLKRKINYKSIDNEEFTLDLYTALVVHAQKIV